MKKKEEAQAIFALASEPSARACPVPNISEQGFAPPAKRRRKEPVMSAQSNSVGSNFVPLHGLKLAPLMGTLLAQNIPPSPSPSPSWSSSSSSLTLLLDLTSSSSQAQPHGHCPNTAKLLADRVSSSTYHQRWL